MTAAAFAASHPAASSVDAGTFSVIANGNKVAGETFTIQQQAGESTIHAEFRALQAGSTPPVEIAVQMSDMQLGANGELRKYVWKEVKPGNSELSVAPNDDFLLEKYADGPKDKGGAQPFLLPATTVMLDDYSFVQRELLAWRYLATSCKPDKGVLSCPLHQKTMFGTLNPHARVSMPVSMEYAGREKVTIHGSERDLIRLDLKSDTGEWGLWLDDQLKLLRIMTPGDSIEVLRD